MAGCPIRNIAVASEFIAAHNAVEFFIRCIFFVSCTNDFFVLFFRLLSPSSLSLKASTSTRTHPFCV